MKLPKVGDKLYMFDDGKLRASRLYEVEITNIIKSENARSEYHKFLQHESKTCHWLYETETDYFIVAKHPEEEEMIFVREKKGGYFSLGYWAGRLDLDGSLFKRYCEVYEITEKEARSAFE